MKKIIILLSVTFFCNRLKAQFVDPSNTILVGQNQAMISLQSQQVATIIEQMGVTKETLQQIKQGLQVTREGVQIARQGVQFAENSYKIMKEIEDGKVNFNMMNYLKINNLQDLVDQILCVKLEDFVPQNETYYNVFLNFRGSILNCNNSSYYGNTYSGLVNSILKGDFRMSSLAGNVPAPVLPTGVSGTPTRSPYNVVSTNSAIAEMDAQIQNAMVYENFSSTMNDRLKLEIGYKYLALADKLYQDADELFKVVSNQDNPVKMEWSQRQQIIMSCVDFEMKSFDYKLKGMDLIKQASSSPAAKSAVQKQSDVAKINIINQQVLGGK